MNKSNVLDENRNLNKRKDLYFNLQKCENLFIPICYIFSGRTTLNTQINSKIRSAKERNVIEKSIFQKFQNKSELLKIRREDCTNYLFEKIILLQTI